MAEPIIHEKTCFLCSITKPIDEFCKDRRTKDGRTGYCRECQRARHKKWRNTPEGKASLKVYWQKYYSTEHGSKKIKDYLRAKDMKNLGRTLGDYYQTVASQGGRCAICMKLPAKDEKALAIDHDHATNEFRGLLCDLCNRGLGFFRDNPDLFEQAKQYLLKHQLKLVA